MGKSGFDVYVLYCALKAHFNSKSYDFIKYNGKMKSPTRESFEKRHDKQFFAMLANKNMDYILPYFVANFVANENLWVGDLILNQDAEETYFAWKRKMSRIYSSTIEEFRNIKMFLDSRNLSFGDLFLIKNGQQPILFRLVTERFISLETYVIMDQILVFSKDFDKYLDHDLVYKRWSLKAKKYSPFLIVNRDRLKKELKNIFI
jgi:hypothetical protein